MNCCTTLPFRTKALVFKWVGLRKVIISEGNDSFQTHSDGEGPSVKFILAAESLYPALLRKQEGLACDLKAQDVKTIANEEKKIAAFQRMYVNAPSVLKPRQRCLRESVHL